MTLAITQQQLENLKDNKILSDWERGFIESIAGQFAKSGKLSTAQEQVLNRCLEKTSADKVKERNDWVSSYNDEKRKIARLCANYYIREGYFNGLATSILSDNSFIPTKEQYEKMCENKYAKRVIEASETPAEFEVGDLAIIRSTLRRNSLESRSGTYNSKHYTDYHNKMVVILEYDNSRPRTEKMVVFTLLTDPSVKLACGEKFLKKNRKK